MFNNERKAKTLSGGAGLPMLGAFSDWLGQPGIPQRLEYQYEPHYGETHLRVGSNLRRLRASTTSNLSPDTLRNHAWSQSGLLYSDWASRLNIEQLKDRFTEKHYKFFLGAGASVGLTNLSDLIDNLIPEIVSAIEASREILAMGHDYDGGGSVGYSETTWDRATEFLKRSAFALRIHHDTEIQAPRILHGPDGGIDFHWKTNSHELLINIPADPREPADFYGDSGPNNTIKGKLDTSAQNEWILMWLTS